MTPPSITSYRFGRIEIDGQVYTKDVIILPDRVIGDWWRREGHALRPTDLESVLDAAPLTLIVGQGAFGRMQVTDETRKLLVERGIELLALPTKEACKRYGELKERRDVAAALHLTC
jgi:hypothetical protein